VLGIILLIAMAGLSGCVGGAAFHRVECESDYPLNNYIYRKNDWGITHGYYPNPLNKHDFLIEFGKPDEIVTILPEKEMWVYKRHDICGLLAGYIIVPVPLIAPCDVFDHITFEIDKAVHIHFRRVSMTGGMIGYPIGAAAVKAQECPGKQTAFTPPKPPPSEIPEILAFHGAVSIPNTENSNRVTYRDGAIWWTDGMVNTKIDPSSHEVIDSIPVSNSKYASLDFARGFGSVWFAADSHGNSLLTRVEPETGNIVATIPLAENSGAIATGADAVWVIHNKMVSRINPQTNQVVATIPVDYLSASYGKIAVSSNAVWIFLGNFQKVIRIDPLTNRVANSFQLILDKELSATIIDMAAAKDFLWVLAFKERDKGSYKSAGDFLLAKYDAMTNVLITVQNLGSSSEDVFKPSIAVSENDVWVCFLGGIYFIPKDAVR